METTNCDFDIDDEWQKYISTPYEDMPCNNEDESGEDNSEIYSAVLEFDNESKSPKSSDIYISTKTKMAYFNQQINLKEVFWKIPTITYGTPMEGVIKKQIKCNSNTQEEVDEIKELLKNEIYVNEYVITSINNPLGRIKFKDIRKISIGVSHKDIMSYRCKKKSAFYNCFVLIVRIKKNDMFKEFHVKIFNTGKLEIPGIQDEELFQKLLAYIICIVQPFVKGELYYKPNSEETVLINSNFNCGYFINREALHDILKYKYNILSIYDPCSYPGIQSKFYYNHDVEVQTGSQISEENKHLYKNVSAVSFMIFRTGSVLIVGKCDEQILMCIYDYLKMLLNNEHSSICQKNCTSTMPNKLIETHKKRKIRKKIINVNIISPTTGR